jgi:very-short-patch-repair endonuclease
VTYRPRSAPSQTAVADAVLDELENVALSLFPAWLPAAQGIDGPGGAGIAAVRALAIRLGSSIGHFGPFLADVAERALRRAEPAAGRFPQETRAAGLARVIAASFDRSTAGVLVHVPPGLTGDGEYSLVGACEWLAHRGGLGVWLAGEPLAVVDWLTTIPVRLPEDVARLDLEVPQPPTEPSLPTMWFPPLAGRPHPASSAEQALESALAQRPWATGRAWNQTYQSHLLVNPVRLDLVWPDERCVVEIDGPEHREALRFEADRRRDVQLQLDGYAVLRFTNANISQDLEIVVSRIERFIVQARRHHPSEGHRYARRL